MEVARHEAVVGRREDRSRNRAAGPHPAKGIYAVCFAHIPLTRDFARSLRGTAKSVRDRIESAPSISAPSYSLFAALFLDAVPLGIPPFPSFFGQRMLQKMRERRGRTIASSIGRGTSPRGCEGP